MPNLKFNAIHLFIFSSILTSVSTADNACDSPITDAKKRGSDTPFNYCLKDDRFTWINTIFNMGGNNLCPIYSGMPSRVALMNIDIYIYRSIGTEPCGFGVLSYREKKSGSCISALVKPFLETFSGKIPSPGQVETPPLTLTEASSDIGQGEIISYQFDCIVDSNTINMCRHNTSSFEGTSTVKMLFSQESLGESTNCYCSIKTPDIQSITARALDIRLNGANRLFFDSYQLPTEEIYWSRDDVIGSGFSEIKLLDLQSMPSSVWMKLTGLNLTITCDNKPLDRSGDNGSYSSPSSAGGFSIVHIIGIIGGCIVVLLVLMCLMKRCMKRNNPKDDDLDMEDYEMAEPVSDNSTRHPEEETLISSQQHDVEYAKPTKRGDRGTDVDIELYDKPRIYKPEEDERNENQVTNNNQNSDVSSTGSNEVSSKENLSDDNATNTAPNIYSHFGDKPDIVPSSSSNIYDAMGKDDYSVLERHPNTVTTDNLYDVA